MLSNEGIILLSLSKIFPFHVVSERIFHLVNTLRLLYIFNHINIHICSRRLYICMYDDELCYAYRIYPAIRRDCVPLELVQITKSVL